MVLSHKKSTANVRQRIKPVTKHELNYIAKMQYNFLYLFNTPQNLLQPINRHKISRFQFLSK